MNPNIPFRMVFAERLMPLMRGGASVQIPAAHGGYVHAVTYDVHADVFSVDGQQMEPLEAFYCMADMIHTQSPSGSFLQVNGQNYLPVVQIDAHYPGLECGGDRVFKSWRKNCECVW